MRIPGVLKVITAGKRMAVISDREIHLLRSLADCVLFEPENDIIPQGQVC